MHSGDRLHHAAVAQTEAVAIDGLHVPDVRAAVLRQRDVLVALDGARHAGRPQQLLAQVAVDELVQVEQILQQLPALRERRRHQLDQRLGIVGGDVLVGERGAEQPAGAAVRARLPSGSTRSDSFSTPLRPPCRICGSPPLTRLERRRSKTRSIAGSSWVSACRFAGYSRKCAPPSNAALRQGWRSRPPAGGNANKSPYQSCRRDRRRAARPSRGCSSRGRAPGGSRAAAE